MWYKLEVKKLFSLLLPTFLRGKNKLQAFVFSLAAPVSTIYDTWLHKREEDLYKIKHTGQVFSLRKALNDRFDPVYRRFQILDGNRVMRKHIFTTIEQLPIFLDSPFHIHSSIDYDDTGADFIVNTPSELFNSNKFELYALINFYKQDVKRFKIELI